MSQVTAGKSATRLSDSISRKSAPRALRFVAPRLRLFAAMLVRFEGGEYDGQLIELAEPLKQLEDLPRPTGTGFLANLRYRLHRGDDGEPLYVFEHSLPPPSSDDDPLATKASS